MIEKIVAPRDLAKHPLDVVFLFRARFEAKFGIHSLQKYGGRACSPSRLRKYRQCPLRLFEDEGGGAGVGGERGGTGDLMLHESIGMVL